MISNSELPLPAQKTESSMSFNSPSNKGIQKKTDRNSPSKPQAKTSQPLSFEATNVIPTEKKPAINAFQSPKQKQRTTNNSLSKVIVEPLNSQSTITVPLIQPQANPLSFVSPPVINSSTNELKPQTSNNLPKRRMTNNSLSSSAPLPETPFNIPSMNQSTTTPKAAPTKQATVSKPTPPKPRVTKVPNNLTKTTPNNPPITGVKRKLESPTSSIDVQPNTPEQENSPVPQQLLPPKKMGISSRVPRVSAPSIQETVKPQEPAKKNSSTLPSPKGPPPAKAKKVNPSSPGTIKTESQAIGAPQNLALPFATPKYDNS